MITLWSISERETTLYTVCEMVRKFMPVLVKGWHLNEYVFLSYRNYYNILGTWWSLDLYQVWHGGIINSLLRNKLLVDIYNIQMLRNGSFGDKALHTHPVLQCNTDLQWEWRYAEIHKRDTLIIMTMSVAAPSPLGWQAVRSKGRRTCTAPLLGPESCWGAWSNHTL